MQITKILAITAVMLSAQQGFAANEAAKLTIQHTLNRIRHICQQQGNLYYPRAKGCGHLCGSGYDKCMYKTLNSLLPQPAAENQQPVANTTDKIPAQPKKSDNTDCYHYGC